MSITIVESDMPFVFGDSKRWYHIENSELYRSFRGNVHTVEFVFLDRKNTLQFVEAKKSCPNVDNKGESKEKKEKYEEYYEEITQKYNDSLNLFAAILLGRYSDEEMGDEIAALSSLRDIRIRAVLVIKDAEESWLSGPKTELERRLLPLRRIWKMEIVVLNEELAHKKRLVDYID